MAYAPLTVTRRECLTTLVAVAAFPALRVGAADGKSMRGAFMILSKIVESRFRPKITR